MVSVSYVVSEILKEKDSCNGVTILGGEPFDQSPVVAELVSRLKHHGLHVTVYSGFTIEQLINKKDRCIDYILTHIDLLIDGPFLTGSRSGAGEYRGSTNQRVEGVDVTNVNKLVQS